MNNTPKTHCSNCNEELKDYALMSPTLDKKKRQLCTKCAESHVETGMGASQWKEHGRRFGYWNFFLSQYNAGLREKIGGMRRIMVNPVPDSDEIVGYNSALSSVLALLGEKEKI